jgi:hypothetical protein
MASTESNVGFAPLCALFLGRRTCQEPCFKIVMKLIDGVVFAHGTSTVYREKV